MRKGASHGLRLPSRSQVVRAIVIGGAALPLMWLIVVQNIAAATRALRPDIAIGWASWDARALAGSAERLLVSRPRQGSARQRAKALANQALARDPTVVGAVRSLGIVADIDRQGARARRLFYLAHQLSRRDLPTQLWLIEERVSHDDVRGALGHYDIALRTSSQSFDILLPVLVSATTSEGVIRPLGELLARQPRWRRAFLERLAGGPPDPDKAVRLLNAISAGRTPYERVLMRDLLARLVDSRKFAAAARLYRDVLEPVRGRAMLESLIRNGGFSEANSAPPFDWWLSADSDLLAEVQSGVPGGSGQSLALRAASGHGGTLARQFLLLAPGNYGLSFVGGQLPAIGSAQVSILVTCANETPTIILALQPSLNSRRQMAVLRVPALCPGQWLQIGISPNFVDDTGGWVDSFEIRRLGAGRGA